MGPLKVGGNSGGHEEERIGCPVRHDLGELESRSGIEDADMGLDFRAQRLGHCKGTSNIPR